MVHACAYRDLLAARRHGILRNILIGGCIKSYTPEYNMRLTPKAACRLGPKPMRVIDAIQENQLCTYVSACISSTYVSACISIFKIILSSPSPTAHQIAILQQYPMLFSTGHGRRGGRPMSYTPARDREGQAHKTECGAVMRCHARSQKQAALPARANVPSMGCVCLLVKIFCALRNLDTTH
jgi:hypothetical protein